MFTMPNTLISPLKEPLKILSKNGNNKRDSDHQTPREMWLKKEKVLKIKFFIILLLTHSFWFLGTETKKVIVNKPSLKVMPGHHLLKVPSKILTPLPRDGERIKVSLYVGKSLIAKKAYLRHASQKDESMQMIAVLEIPDFEARKLKDLKEEQSVKVLPYLFNNETVQFIKNKESIFEMDI